MMLRRMTVAGVMAVLAVSVWGLTPDEFETLYDHELRLVVSGCTTAPQDDFRLLVRLAETIPGFRYSQLRSSGADIRFALEDGTVLPHECDTWNPSGESTFWVKVPQLKQGLVLRMRYGRDNDTAPDGSVVWGSDYVGVWHMNIKDGFVAESVNGYHGAVSNRVQVQSAPGAVGDSYYNPSHNTSLAPCVTVGNTNGSYAVFNALTDNLSFSAWVKYTGGKAGEGKYGTWWDGWGNDRYDGIYSIAYSLEGGPTSVSLTDKGKRAAGIACPTLSGVWHHVVVTYLNGHRKFYIDGVEVAAADNCDTAGYRPIGQRWTFGAQKPTATFQAGYWVGGLDEFRAQRSAVSAERIKAEYEMVKAGASYLAPIVSDEERASYAHALDLVVSGYAGNPLSDFRLLVCLKDNVTSGFAHADSKTCGGDFLFTLADGTALASELDTWNPSGASTFWVRVPQLTAGLVLKMHYGKEGEVRSNPSGVWNDYAGVWHMSIVDGRVPESAHGYDGVVANAVQVQSAQGVVGGSYFNPSQDAGATPPSVSVEDANGVYDAFDALPGEMTFSSWVKYTGVSSAGAYGSWWNTCQTEHYTGMYGLDYALEGSAVRVSLTDMGTRAASISCPSLFGDWHQVVVSYAGGHRKVYIDGCLYPDFDNCENARYVPTPRSWDKKWFFGNRSFGNSFAQSQWVGGLDEFRAYPGALEAARITTEYEMVRNAGTFVTVKATITDEEKASYGHCRKLVVSGYAGAPLADYRLLVRLTENAVPGFSHSDSKESGGDFLFTLEDGTILASELDTWNLSGESSFWVRIPRMVPGLVLKMYYGKTGASRSDPTSVWAGYTGVWHMNIAEGKVPESAHGYRGIVQRTDCVKSVAGAIGGSFSNPVQDNGEKLPCVYVEDANGAYDAFGGMPPESTFASWVKYTGENVKGHLASWWNTCQTERYTGLNGLDFSLEGSATKISISDMGERAEGLTCPQLSGDWHQVVVSYAGGHRKVYIDGNLCSNFDNCATAKFVPTARSLNKLWIFGGRSLDNGYPSLLQWIGGLDEFRAYPGVLEPERIKAEYKMLSSDTSYVRFFDETDDEPFLKYADLTVTGCAEGVVLTNFPLCVRVSPQTIRGFRYSNLRADGRDLMFSTVDGTPLDFEVDTWNPKGDSIYWVRIPELMNGTVVRMNYGRATAANNGGLVGSVWDGYAGVWHVNEPANGEASLADASPTPVATTGGANSIATNGVFGAARGSRMKENKGPSVFTTDYATKFDLGTTFTVSFYVRRGEVNAPWSFLVTRKRWIDSNAAWGIQNRSNLGLRPGFWSGSDSPAPSPVYSFPDLDINTWHKMDAVYEGMNCYLYVDGVQVAQEEKSVPPSWGAYGLSVGGSKDFYGTFPGDLDEIRYFAGRKSDAWIKAEYDMSGLGGETPLLTYGKATRYEPVGMLLIVR